MNDHWKHIVASADIADKPPGVRVLDWLTDKYEREGGSVRTVSAAIRAKIAAHELAQAAKHAKANAQAITASLMPAPQKPAAKPAPPSAKSIMAIFKAMPPGPARTAFYQKHRSILKP